MISYVSLTSFFWTNCRNDVCLRLFLPRPVLNGIQIQSTDPYNVNLSPLLWHFGKFHKRPQGEAIKEQARQLDLFSSEVSGTVPCDLVPTPLAGLHQRDGVRVGRMKVCRTALPPLWKGCSHLIWLRPVVAVDPSKGWPCVCRVAICLQDVT